jgi:hypothetical protein
VKVPPHEPRGDLDCCSANAPVRDHGIPSRSLECRSGRAAKPGLCLLTAYRDDGPTRFAHGT